MANTVVEIMLYNNGVCSVACALNISQISSLMIYGSEYRVTMANGKIATTDKVGANKIRAEWGLPPIP